jgi:hypothetical protein
MKNGTIKAYPNDEWNTSRNLNMTSVTSNDISSACKAWWRMGAAPWG